MKLSNDTSGSFSANSKNLKSFRLKQQFSNVIIASIVVVSLVGGVLIYRFYQQTHNNQNSEAESSIASDEPAIAQNDATITEDDFNTNPNTPAGTGGGGTSPSSPSGGGPSTPSQVSTSSIPSEVVTILDSIEQSGIHNNPHIAIDTSVLPNDTHISFNRSTWTMAGSNSGSIDGVITIQGNSRSGTVLFEVINGSWQATGYGLNY